MSIARRQLEMIADKILQQEFQNGRVLSVEELMVKVQAVLNGIVPGSPITKYRPAVSRHISSYSDWNDTVEEIHTDLNTVYDESVDQVSRIITDFDYFEVEKKKLERRIQTLDDTIEEFLLLTKNTDGYLYSVFDYFRTLENVDLSNNEAWIDLVAHEACLPHAKTGNKKADLTSMNIFGSVLTGDGKPQYFEIEPLRNLLDDSLNTVWLGKVSTNAPVELEYQVELTLTGEEINRLQLRPNVSEKIIFTIMYTEDNLNWYTLTSQTAQETMTFDFPGAEFLGLRFILKATNYDEKIALEDGTVRYDYFFGINNISLLKIGYENTAVYQSKYLPVLNRQGQPVSLDKLSLEVEEDVPQGTTIDYYLGLKQKDGTSLDWQSITPVTRSIGDAPKVINLLSLVSDKPISGLDASSVETYSEGSTNLFNGLSFYELSSRVSGEEKNISSDRIIDRDSFNLFLYKGVGQFKKEYYSYQYSDDIYHEPAVSDWINIPEATTGKIPVVTRFSDVAQTIVFPGTESYHSYRITTNVFLKEAKESILAKIKVSTTDSGTPRLNMHILVNGIKVTAGYSFSSTVQEIALPFVSGWNTLTLLIYKPNGLQTTLDLGMNLNNWSSNIRGELESLNYVSLFDYLYNTFEKEDLKFSITDDNVLIISDYQRQQLAKYEFSYRFTLDHGYSHELALKAVLTGTTDGKLSPRIKYWKVRSS